MTRFVRELLGIDHLDALIEGLHASRDVRRLRRLVPVYGQAQAEQEILTQQELRTRSKLAALEREKAAYSERLREQLSRLLPATAVPALDDQDGVERLLAGRPDEQRQLTLNWMLRNIQALRVEWEGASSAAAEAERRVVEEAAQTAAARLSAWRSGAGGAIERLIQELRSDFPNLPSPVATGPEFAQSEALSAVLIEVERCAALLAQDDADATRLVGVVQHVKAMEGRIETLDQESSKLAGDAEGLGEALRDLLPHISGNECPVCDRDFGEVSKEELSAHLANKLTRLADRAARLQTAAKARVEAVNSLALARREEDALRRRQLTPDARARLLSRRETLEAAAQRLRQMAVGAKEGARLAAEAFGRGLDLAEFEARHQRGLAIRHSITELAREAESSARPDSEFP